MKNYINILIGTCLLAFTSCHSFLDEMPDDRTVIDSPEKIGELLTHAYPNQNHQMFCYAMSDNATDKGKSGSKNEINSDAYNWLDFRLTSQDTPESYWTGCYSSIKQVNHALDAIEKSKVNGKISEEAKPFYGEALIARAYCHFMLVNLWSPTYNPATAKTDLGIPYVTKSETNVLTTYNRGSVAQVYENLEKDIIEGLKYIDDKAYANKVLHWNIKAAHTFVARFYSLKGEFDKVLEHTNMVLSSDPAESLRDLTGEYSRMDVNEVIIQWGRTSEKANLLVVPQYSRWFIYFFGSYQYAMSDEFHKDVFRKSFVGADWIWDLYGGDPDILFVKWGYHTEKTGLNSDVGYHMIMNVLVDMEEALFLRMEANTMLKNYEATSTDMDSYLSKRVKGYNSVTHKVDFTKMDKEYKESNFKYGLNPFYALDDMQRVYMNCLYDLRRKEYYYTGMRWFDHRRFNTQVRHYFADGSESLLSDKDPRKQLQIPLNAQSQGIEANPR
ncbi:RagB/SusD family nutrient uptake outer membrane protein [Ancylomarina sp.]|uniref:RagB/SusD family nutrient uptake outer membrane protein n=1 Tax=Ancylomarina sp. TaxID=1970196 RepID=UPI0035641BAD